MLFLWKFQLPSNMQSIENIKQAETYPVQHFQCNNHHPGWSAVSDIQNNIPGIDSGLILFISLSIAYSQLGVVVDTLSNYCLHIFTTHIHIKQFTCNNRQNRDDWAYRPVTAFLIHYAPNITPCRLLEHYSIIFVNEN